MEQARILLAIALSFLVFLVWGWFFDGKKPVGTENKAAVLQQDAGTPDKIEPSPVAPVPDKFIMPEVDGQPAKTVVVETPYYRVRIPETGAGFTSFLLNKYKETNDPGSDRLQMVDSGLPSGTVQVRFDKNSLKGLETARFISNTTEEYIKVRDEPRQVSFVHEDPGGLVLMKTYTFSPDTYLIDLAVTVVNNSDRTYQDSLVLALYNAVSEKATQYGFVGPSALINNSLEQVKIKKIEDKNRFSGSIKWVAYQDRYFLAGILPKAPLDATFRLVLDDPGILSSQLVNPANALPPGTRQTENFQVYLGPKSAGILKDLNRDLDRAVDFGWFNMIAKACLWLMNHIYSIIPNYGVAIIIMTILIKILLWPLGSKSYKSMGEMKKVQPLMTEIREKYKDDKKKMNEEMMGLYRTYKINPMSGCLPMVVQIPVFIAFYRMLYEAIELRHAPFFGWITDLSAPDRLFSFNFTIPFMQDPGIPVLTLIMGGTMFLQQKMSPPMGDPAQAKMMMMMPIIFTVIFINFSSGLVLYWLVNNILSISQQYYIQKKYA